MASGVTCSLMSKLAVEHGKSPNQARSRSTSAGSSPNSAPGSDLSSTAALPLELMLLGPPPGLEDAVGLGPLGSHEDDDDSTCLAKNAHDMPPVGQLFFPPAPAVPPPPPSLPPLLGLPPSSAASMPAGHPLALVTHMPWAPFFPPPLLLPPSPFNFDKQPVLPPPYLAPPPAQPPVLPTEMQISWDVPPPTQKPVLDLAEAFLTEPGCAGLPSVGSEDHHSGTCKPCAFLHTKGCVNGAQCQYCHLCTHGEKKRRMKEKRMELRNERRFEAFGSKTGRLELTSA